MAILNTILKILARASDNTPKVPRATQNTVKKAEDEARAKALKEAIDKKKEELKIAENEVKNIAPENVMNFTYLTETYHPLPPRGVTPRYTYSENFSPPPHFTNVPYAPQNNDFIPPVASKVDEIPTTSTASKTSTPPSEPDNTVEDIISANKGNPTDTVPPKAETFTEKVTPEEVVSPPLTEVPVSSTGSSSSLSGKILPWVWDTANTGAWGYAGGSIGANLTDDRNIWGYSPNEAGFLAGLTAIALANGRKTFKGVNNIIHSPSARNALVKTVSNIKNKGGVFPAVGAVAVNSSRNSEKEEKSTSSSFNGGRKRNYR